MNSNLATLYDDLMRLCEKSESFYFVDQQDKDGVNYRTFTYRLASFTEFQERNAIECRGHTFRETRKGMQLVSLPFQKFFNISENPSTMDLDLSKISTIMDKLDGSLISTVEDNYGEFFLKSKASFNSTQAVAANILINTPAYSELKEFCQTMVNRNRTVSMEYVAPFNGNVLLVSTPALTVLAVRDNTTGAYMDRDTLFQSLDASFIVKSHPIPENPVEWVQSVYDSLEQIEGYVIVIDGVFVKIKTNLYKSLHGLLSNLNSPKRLFEIILNESIDDAIPLIKDNDGMMALVESETTRIRSLYVTIDNEVETFYNLNKNLDRKSFAILGTETLTRPIFGLVMNKYIGRDYSLKDWMIKNYELFKVKEESLVLE